MSHIDTGIKRAMILMQEKVYQVIDRFVKEYYVDYTPEEYIRTYQLYKSLVKSEIVASGKGYEARVYFDLSRLDYYVQQTRSRGTSYRNDVSQYDLANLVVTNASHGYHGKYKGEADIWDSPIDLLDSSARLMLKNALVSAGIPVV